MAGTCAMRGRSNQYGGLFPPQSFLRTGSRARGRTHLRTPRWWARGGNPTECVLRPEVKQQACFQVARAQVVEELHLVRSGQRSFRRDCEHQPGLDDDIRAEGAYDLIVIPDFRRHLRGDLESSLHQLPRKGSRVDGLKKPVTERVVHVAGCGKDAVRELPLEKRIMTFADALH